MKHEKPGPAPLSDETAEPVALNEFKLPCRHLRSKEMYYQEAGAPEDPYASGIFWCGRTQESFGPDGDSCGKEECCSGRSCYLV